MDHEVFVDQGNDPMDHDLEPASPARASPAHASPTKQTAASTGDVEITGTGFTAPGEPVTLSKHTAKDEVPSKDKGKWSTDLSSYAQLSAQELHSGYLNRLYTSRDHEAGLVNMIKECYEVTFLLFDLHSIPAYFS